MYRWRWPSFHPFTFSPFLDSFHFELGKFANKGDVPQQAHPLILRSMAVRKALICHHGATFGKVMGNSGLSTCSL